MNSIAASDGSQFDDAETQLCDSVQCISVIAQADPGALARVIEPFAKLGLIPLSVTSRHFADADQLVIDIQIAGMAEELGQKIAKTIGSIPMTVRVLTGKKYIVLRR
jgi:acetolactate synthase small subunit